MALVFALALMLQLIVLPCLCDVGAAKVKFAFVLDVLVAVRVLIAYLGRERGNGWKFYAWLLGASPVWIEAIAFLVFGER